jgi:hypothetical protein
LVPVLCVVTLIVVAVLVGVTPGEGICAFVTALECWTDAIGVVNAWEVGEGVIALVAIGEGIGVDVVVTEGDGVLVVVGGGVSVVVGEGVLVIVGGGVPVSVSWSGTCPLIVFPLTCTNPVLAYAEVVNE